MILPHLHIAAMSLPVWVGYLSTLVAERSYSRNQFLQINPKWKWVLVSHGPIYNSSFYSCIIVKLYIFSQSRSIRLRKGKHYNFKNDIFCIIINIELLITILMMRLNNWNMFLIVDWHYSVYFKEVVYDWDSSPAIFM